MFGLTLSKPALYALVVAAALALAGLGFWRGMAAIDNAREAAVAAAIETRDSYWREQIAISNAAAEKERASIAERVIDAEAARGVADAAAADAYERLRKKNEALPDGDGCGVSAERGGLLDSIR
ncbi:hypothetical protein [Bosea thiooxidans]